MITVLDTGTWLAEQEVVQRRLVACWAIRGLRGARWRTAGLGASGEEIVATPA